MNLEERRKIAEGRQAEIFEWDDGSVLKLYRNTGMGHEAEAAALSAIAGAGGLGPRLLGRTEIDGRPAFMIERIDGADMLALVSKAPWRMARLARSLAEAHAAVHRVAAPPGLPELKEMLAARIRETLLSSQLKSFALEHVDALPEGDRLLHGDFHPGNVLVTASGVSVIDWPNAARGHPGADHARTALLITIGDPPPLPPHIRVMVMAGRRLFSSIYGGKYRRLLPVDRSLLRHAHIAHVAARIWEGIEVEIPKLTAFLEKARGA